jgi:hypothetical protein
VEAEIVQEPIVEVVVEPVVEQVVVVPELFVYEYQAVDDSGRALGAKQVFKGATAQEVLDKVANANKELIKLNRELKKNMRIGKYDNDEIPDDAAHFGSETVEFNPVTLTPEERFTLSRDLNDPERFDEASKKLFEATIGASPDKIRAVLNSSQQNISSMRAKMEAELWVATTPEYYPCNENFETITNWMVKNDLAPVRANFQLAFSKLTEVGLLLEAPIVREEIPVVVEPERTLANTPPAQEDVSRITDVEPAQTKRTVREASSGLNRTQSSDTGIEPKRGYSQEEIDRMGSEEYKRKVLIPEWKKSRQPQ